MNTSNRFRQESVLPNVQIEGEGGDVFLKSNQKALQTSTSLAVTTHLGTISTFAKFRTCRSIMLKYFVDLPLFIKFMKFVKFIKFIKQI